MPVVMPGFSLESKMLHMTIWEDNLSGVENMLAAGADVNWPENHSGETPLIAALRRNNSEIVKRLLRVKSLRVSKADEKKMKEVTCKKCDCKQSLYDRYLQASVLHTMSGAVLRSCWASNLVP